MNLEKLQNLIGHHFSDISLLREALTHRSYGQSHNERLEFLGDSILNCVVSVELYSRHAELREGELSRLRAHHVRQESLHQIARKLDLGRFLQLGEGELKSGGSARPSILADAFEALVGAIYLDAGYEQTRSVLRKIFEESLGEHDASSFGKDSKTVLQEYLQGRRLGLPRYSVASTEGAAHDQTFRVECQIAELSICTLGTGASRRAAEQQAAQHALDKLDYVR